MIIRAFFLILSVKLKNTMHNAKARITVRVPVDKEQKQHNTTNIHKFLDCLLVKDIFFNK